MERLVSKYKNNVIASKKKHIFSRLLDYFSLFVVTYLLFTVFYSLGVRTPVMTNSSKKLQQESTQVAEYIDSTHLQRLNANRSALISIDEGAAAYVENICKTSAYVHNLTFPVKNEGGTFDELVITVEETFVNNPTSYELDNISYYYKSFKKNEPSLNNYVYEENDYKDDIDTYLYLKIMKVDATKFVTGDDEDYLARGNNISRYVVLSKEQTTTLLRYYKEDRADTSLYNDIYSSYIKAAQYGVEDIENNSIPYKTLVSEFNKTYQEITLEIFVIYLISYTVAYLLLTIILRLICKEWVTLGQKVMGLGVSSSDELEPNVAQLIGYHVFNYVTFVTSIFIGLYFMGMLGVFTAKILGPVTLFAIFVALFATNLVSFFMQFFNKNNHDLSTLITRILVKDKSEFESLAGSEEPPVLEEKSDGRNEQ